MTQQGDLLVMAGAREAHQIVQSLLARGVGLQIALPEPERSFDPFATTPHIERFADAAALDRWLDTLTLRGVIDAGHAFESDLSALLSGASAARGLPYLRLLRPAWAAENRDRWIEVADVWQAAAAVPRGARAFCNTGWPSQPDYAAFQGDALFLRQTDLRDDASPFPFLHYVQGTPPFSLKDEIDLFRHLRIDVLICRNVGGRDSLAKLNAARALGLQVIMVDRPAPPQGAEIAETIPQVLHWTKRL